MMTRESKEDDKREERQYQGRGKTTTRERKDNNKREEIMRMRER